MRPISVFAMAATSLVVTLSTAFTPTLALAQVMKNSPGGVQAEGDVTVNQAPPQLGESLDRIEERQRIEAERTKRLEEKFDRALRRVPSDVVSEINREFAESTLVYLSAPGEVKARDSSRTFWVDWNSVKVTRENDGMLVVNFGEIIYNDPPSVVNMRWTDLTIGIEPKVGKEFVVIHAGGVELVVRVIAAENGGVMAVVGKRLLVGS